MRKLFILLALLPALAWAQDPGLIIDGEATVTLTWVPPTEYEDETFLDPADLAGYVVFWDTASRFQPDLSFRPGCGAYPVGARNDGSCYANVLDLTDGSATTELLTLTLSEDVTLHFALVAHTNNGQWSAYSNEATRSLVLRVDSPPGPPEQLDVEISITCTTNMPRVTCSFDVQ